MAEDFRKVADPKGISEFDRGYAVPDCVVLDSAYCSMGRMIALRAAKAAGWEMHDANSLLALAGECGVTMADVDAFEEEAARPGADLAALAATDEFRRIRDAFRLAAERALAQGPCLIHDRVDRGFVEGLGKTCACAMTFASDRAAMRVRGSRCSTPTSRTMGRSTPRSSTRTRAVAPGTPSTAPTRAGARPRPTTSC